MSETSLFERKIQQQIAASPEPPRTFDNYTIGDLVRAILSIHDEAEAAEFYRTYVEYIKVVNQLDPPENVAKSNIGWCFGEGMAPKEIAMWRKVCGASHPIFGSMTPLPSSEDAINAGLKAGQELRANQETK